MNWFKDNGVLTEAFKRSRFSPMLHLFRKRHDAGEVAQICHRVTR